MSLCQCCYVVMSQVWTRLKEPVLAVQACLYLIIFFGTWDSSHLQWWSQLRTCGHGLLSITIICYFNIYCWSRVMSGLVIWLYRRRFVHWCRTYKLVPRTKELLGDQVNLSNLSSWRVLIIRDALEKFLAIAEDISYLHKGWKSR